jgi:CubicO group peptidase (beta-lactamase class C family)
LPSSVKAALAAALSILIAVAPAASPAQSPPPPPVLAPVPAPLAMSGVTALPPAELEAYVDGMVRDAMAADRIPGVTISVVQNGQVVLKKGYGFARLGPAAPVDPDRTLFRIASISKTFTWIAVMKEVEAGRMRLDAPINLYLPEKIQVRDQGFDHPVRVIDLMGHAPGFEDRALGQLFERDADRVRPLDVYLRQERPRRVREPGVAPAYSNYGVALAGAAAAWVSGKPYERLIESEITGPLGMRHTTFREPYPARKDLPTPLSAGLARDMATGFLWTGAGWRERPYEFTTQVAPAAGASTTAGDMARYMTMILGGGVLDGVQVYSPATAAGFNRVQSRPAPGVSGFAHGFREFQLPGGRSGWGHDGVLLSFRSSMVVVPSLNMGVFIATNSETGERLTNQITGRIVQRFYGPPPALPDAGSPWLKQNADRFSGEYVSTRRSYRGLEQFIGLIDARTRVAVTEAGYLRFTSRDGSSLWVPEGTGGQFREMSGWRRMSFVMKDGRASAYYPASGTVMFQRAGFFGAQGWLVNLAVLALIAALATLGGLMMRDRKEHRETPMQRRASLMQTTQAILWLLAFATLAIWADKAEDVAAIFFDWPGGWMLTASSCALVAAFLAVVTLVLLPFIWRGGRRVESWTVGRKLRFTVTTLIYVGLSLVLLFRGALVPWAS